MKTLRKFNLLTVMLCVLIGMVGCWYDQDEENHPSDPDRTGVQGWTMTVSIVPNTAPANGTATMVVEARLWDLENQNPIPNQEFYLSIWEGGLPADSGEVSFADGGITYQMFGDANGIARVPIYVGYLSSRTPEKQCYIRAETILEHDNNAFNIWDFSYFRLYNPYFDRDAYNEDGTAPTASFIFFPTEPRVNETVTFDASLSADGTDTETGLPAYDAIVDYRWFFGDGTYGNGRVVTHKFNAEGSYNVELIIYDDEGLPGTASAGVTVAGFM